MSLNFEMSQHSTIPTKVPDCHCLRTLPPSFPCASHTATSILSSNLHMHLFPAILFPTLTLTTNINHLVNALSTTSLSHVSAVIHYQFQLFFVHSFLMACLHTIHASAPIVHPLVLLCHTSLTMTGVLSSRGWFQPCSNNDPVTIYLRT